MALQYFSFLARAVDESCERSQDVTKKDCTVAGWLAGGKLQHDCVPRPCLYLHVVYDQTEEKRGIEEKKNNKTGFILSSVCFPPVAA